MHLLIKTLISAALIVAISEIGKQNSWLAAMVTALPVTAVLAMIWLYQDTRDQALISALSINIFWMVIPSLAFFIALPMLLKRQVPFYAAVGYAYLIMLVFYGLTGYLVKRFGASIP